MTSHVRGRVVKKGTYSTKTKALRADVKRLFGFDPGPDDPEMTAYRVSDRFANDLIKEAVRQGITNKELAKRAGISPSTLSGFLNGGNITVKTMSKLASALGKEIGPISFVDSFEVACEDLDYKDVEETSYERPRLVRTVNHKSYQQQHVGHASFKEGELAS